MSNIEKIFIILPTYNNESTIKRAITSVLEQQYNGSLELIVIPNGCTDSTANVIKQCQEEWNNSLSRTSKKIFDVIEPLGNQKGVVAAYNTGLVRALERSTEAGLDLDRVWVGRMDGDDTWRHDKLQKQSQFISNSDADVVGAQMHIVKEDGTRTGTFTNNPGDHDSIVFGISGGANYIANPVTLHKLSIIPKVGMLEDLFYGAEDFWFWAKVALCGYKFANMPDVLMDYTVAEGIKVHQYPHVGRSIGQLYNFAANYKLMINEIKSDIEKRK